MSLSNSGCLCSEGDQQIAINIYVQPRASKNDIVGIHGDALKVRITAPPVDGKANAMIIAVLSRALQISKSSITLVRGHQGRSKRFRVKGIDIGDAETLLEKAVAQ